eukprot:15463679-Alexandrium_andersonii.AAC.1
MSCSESWLLLPVNTYAQLNTRLPSARHTNAPEMQRGHIAAASAKHVLRCAAGNGRGLAGRHPQGVSPTPRVMLVPSPSSEMGAYGSHF